MSMKQRGFTLLEVIVIIILLGIVGGMLVTFMGTKVTDAPDVTVIVRREAAVERVMERILADYLVEINGADPDNALAAVAANEATYEALDPEGVVEVEFEYVTFSAGGAEQAGAAGDPNLKVTVFVDPEGDGTEQHRLTTLLTLERTTAGSEDVVNY